MPGNDREIATRDWALVDSIPGWLTFDQAHELARLIQRAPTASVVEIGSHQGRSTATLALAREDARVTAVDPFVTARLFAGQTIRDKFLANLDRLDIAGQVTLLTMTSNAALDAWDADDQLDLLYIDGKHDTLSLLRDLRWVEHVRGGGHVAVHDAFSSLGVTLGLLIALPTSRRLTLTHRIGSLAVFDARAPHGRERLRALGHLPWFLRNLIIKVLLRLRLRGLTEYLGHSGPFDPY
ncbi:class I SAM-dependent methyltransferase [Yimella sp. cx-51]|uniref:class I SAM-dependent methyltransferase n=1 Tax=Yimella sp. cx-51 TaxID=2770551 RepID=UPI00165DF9BC|nr:class I SAM-dependent methyltransferase [Yimella sp. cx-51]MBC9957458.1 class I SAM-dependent methyltransferase [Yimella sp. cx-51]QTH39306.1 class I SAM-dependent methyltransferase [Yimella sp. cx-51]